MGAGETAEPSGRIETTIPSKSKAKAIPSGVVFKLDKIHACTEGEKPSSRICSSTWPLLPQGLHRE